MGGEDFQGDKENEKSFQSNFNVVGIYAQETLTWSIYIMEFE